MRFDRDHICFKALCVLDEAADHVRRPELPYSPIGLRFALAFLWACDRSGKREVYDAFWRAAQGIGFEGSSDYVTATNRDQMLYRSFNEIVRRAGLEPSAALKQAMWLARGAPVGVPVSPTVRRRD